MQLFEPIKVIEYLWIIVSAAKSSSSGFDEDYNPLSSILTDALKRSFSSDTVSFRINSPYDFIITLFDFE